ncbi:MAG: hypothetical protein ACRDPF_02670 [Streptosporangiaceae bacterium]
MALIIAEETGFACGLAYADGALANTPAATAAPRPAAARTPVPMPTMSRDDTRDLFHTRLTWASI